ncbi:MAG: hypothetical protein OEY24_00785 [Candidatus Bathyarchaeota archaeon]|nr:hypothetical protein [Candidatus Bathyarchaeota archaeon]MDH5494229.1 hypothetical protein [Candidatus Bathyarchaeota archaeon]
MLFGEAKTRKKVEHLAESYRNCPYINLIAIKENQLFATYFLPERQRWWIESIEKNPLNTIGLEKARVTIVDNIYYPRELRMQLPKNPQDVSPCESNCETCPYYGKCTGCPATIFHRRKGKSKEY